MQPQDKLQRPTKSYGSHPLWQWIVMYLIGGIIIYGLIYLIFFRSSGGY